MDDENVISVVHGDVQPPIVAIPCENNDSEVVNAIPIGHIMNSYNDAQTDEVMRLANIVYPIFCYTIAILQIIFGLHGFAFETIRVIPCLMLLAGLLNITDGYCATKYVEDINANIFTYVKTSNDFKNLLSVQKYVVKISFVAFCVFGFHNSIMENLFVATHYSIIIHMILGVYDWCKKLIQNAHWKSQ